MEKNVSLLFSELWEKNWGELESTSPSLERVKVIPILNKIYVFLCLPWPDMKVLEGILFINASWYLGLGYFMGIYQEQRSVEEN